MIYLIVTTCIENKNGIYNFEHRKNLYLNNTSILIQKIERNFKNKIHLILVENNGKRETYLDQLGCDIVYTNNNEFNGKADAELLDIKQVIREYNIQEDDVIIKITGRYKLTSNIFLDLVCGDSEKYDAFVKFFNVGTLEYMHNDCVLGLYSIRCKYFTNFFYTKTRSPECDFASFIRENIEKEKIKEVETLDLECCFAGELNILIV